MASQICLSTAEALFLWPERYSMYAAHQGMVFKEFKGMVIKDVQQLPRPTERFVLV